MTPQTTPFYTADHGDAVIICGSSVGQVKSNVDACKDETPLPKVRNDARQSTTATAAV